MPAVFRHPAAFFKQFVVGIVLSPVILGVFWIIMVLLLSLGKASGAVVITSITETQYNDIKATTGTSVSWTVIFNAGSSSTPNTESRTELVGKTPTQTTDLNAGQYNWLNSRNDINDTVNVVYDSSGNINFSAGTSSTLSVQPIIGFNTILVRLADSGTSGSQFIAGSVDPQPFGFNMNAVGDYSYAKIEFNEDSPEFNLSGNFRSTFGASLDFVQIRFEGINFEGASPPIPEPSVFLLSLIGLYGLFRRQR